jgi:hypothetical protein
MPVAPSIVRSDGRRTRYCSRECFEIAWNGHLHWCKYRRPHRTQITETQPVETAVVNQRVAFDVALQNGMETVEMV